MRTLALLFALLPALALAQAPADAPSPARKPPAKDQVYKWVDKDGVIHYSSEPPAQGAQPAKLPPLQTYKGGTPPNLSKFDKPTSKGTTAAAQIEIVTPSREETFRGANTPVPVAVIVTPTLEPNQRLIYLLDGTPASQPTTDTSYALTGVERGSHTVTVSLVDEAGTELSTSDSVTFHVKPPTADKAEKKKPNNPARPAPR